MSDYSKFLGRTGAFTSGLLTATGAETLHDTTVTIEGQIDGKHATKTAITNGATPTLDHITGVAFPILVGGNSVAGVAGKGCAIVWGVQSDGTVVCSQGAIQDLDLQGSFVKAPQFPPVAVDQIVFAYMILKAGATAAVSNTFGTTNWDATGYTNVIVDVGELPTRPQID